MDFCNICTKKSLFLNEEYGYTCRHIIQSFCIKCYKHNYNIISNNNENLSINNFEKQKEILKIIHNELFNRFSVFLDDLCNCLNKLKDIIKSKNKCKEILLLDIYDISRISKEEITDWCYNDFIKLLNEEREIYKKLRNILYNNELLNIFIVKRKDSDPEVMNYFGKYFLMRYIKPTGVYSMVDFLILNKYIYYNTNLEKKLKYSKEKVLRFTEPDAEERYKYLENCSHKCLNGHNCIQFKELKFNLYYCFYCRKFMN